MFDSMKKTITKVRQPKKAQKLKQWQDKFLQARESYAFALDRMERREALRNGTKQIKRGQNNREGGGVKDASSVRNIVFELIEAQIDSTIPLPKVTATEERLTENAKALEDKLRCELDRLPFETMNDLQERVCPTQGGALFLVEWDHTKRTHQTVGELSVTSLHPKQVIPQPGVYRVEECDYLFVMLSQTKEYIKKRYGVDVEDEEESDPGARSFREEAAEGKVTQIQCYYRNKEGGIGLFSWVGDEVLEDREDYQARSLKKCAYCGKDWVGETCECGSKKACWEQMDEEVLGEDLEVEIDGKKETIPAGTKLPYYNPKMYPVILRKNVSSFGQFLGSSDVDVIEDQQEGIKKIETSILEKILKGGSYVTLPQNYSIKTDDSNLKIIPIKNPQDKAMIDVITVQPDISKDVGYAEELYQQSRQILGITDSYQGRQDPTATSGKAKEIAVNQAAGRLESKKVMKQAFYGELYEVMAKFLIAYADEPRPYLTEKGNGEQEYKLFSKYDFLDKDEAGQWYYNVNYLFATDSSSSLAGNREAMWQETRMNLKEGAFGNPQDTETLLLFWQIMETLHYPNAGKVKKQLEEKLAQEKKEEKEKERSMQEQPASGQDLSPMPDLDMQGQMVPAG